MKSLFKAAKKHIKRILFVRKSPKADLMKQESIKLRKEKKSDFDRWKKNEQLFNDWDERTLILGSFILPNANVLEFGAGNMVLKNHLKNILSYTPSDLIKRHSDTLVCDLNADFEIDFRNFDTVVFSGVLEYVYDIDKVFDKLFNNINQIVVSYCCSDIELAPRSKNGWLSDLKKNELEIIFKKYNYEITNYQIWRNQSLYNLIKKP